MKITKKHIGKVIKVEFLDHCLGNPDPIKCIAVGHVIKLTDVGVTLRFWEVESGAGSHNDEIMSIMLSTITKFKVLK